MNSHWWGLLLGIVLIFCGVLNLLTGSGLKYWGAAAPPWTWLVFLPVGIVVGFWSARALLRGEGKKPVYTDEDRTRAKERLDRMYLREHGTAPGAPEPQTMEPTAPEPAQPPTAKKPKPSRTLTPEEEARAAKADRKIRQGLLLMLAGAVVFHVAGDSVAWLLSPVLFMVGLCRAAVGAAQKP